MKKGRYVLIGIILLLAAVKLIPNGQVMSEEAPLPTATALSSEEQAALEKQELEKRKYPGWSFDETTSCLTISGTGGLYPKEEFHDIGYENWKWEFVEPDYSDKVKKVVIEPGITCISEGAFSRFKSLREISIPDTVKTIEAYAFYECKSLERIVIPDSVTKIGQECFWDCRSMKSLALGRNVKSIGDRAFYRCKALSEITVAAVNNHLEMESGMLYNKDDRELYLCLPGEEKPVIRTGTKKIAALAFGYNSAMRKITIPASIEVIEGGAFYHCKNLSSIIFPKDSKCRFIKTYTWYRDGLADVFGAFEGCRSLQEISLPDSLEFLGYSIFGRGLGTTVFDGCTSLRRIHFGRRFRGYTYYENLKYLREAIKKKETKHLIEVTISFDGCSSLEAFTVSKENTHFSARDGILYNKNQTELRSYPVARRGDVLRISEGVTKISSVAGYKNQFLREIVIPSSLKEIKETAFQGSKRLTRVSYSNGVGSLKKISCYAFDGCKRLQSVEILGKDTIIGHNAFSNCKALKHVVLGNGVMELRTWAFDNCPRLKSVTVPPSVVRIKRHAFGMYTKSKKTGNTTTFTTVKVKGFCIYGRRGSAADRYAKKYKFAFHAM